ncbi:hypothetical protein BC936DRAFT_138133 [Jimgerdemannia flammicorona]|uniref:Vacuolar segregation subunit 7-domain-containing protein n=1 Tax=Jimgerdemannia flammicorona TaxID=994334 RepID=A0A433DIR6_9FUNG|nr:hypothetical protein BC936DRAFT_138133 [Jimgerdemannia flammicorona]
MEQTSPATATPILTSSSSKRTNPASSPTSSPSKHGNPDLLGRSPVLPLSSSPLSRSPTPASRLESGDEGSNGDASSAIPAAENAAKAEPPALSRRLVDKFNTFNIDKAFGMGTPNPERQLTVEKTPAYDPAVFADTRRPPQQSDTRSVRSLVDSTRSKKKKRPAINTSSTPAEIFAANLSNAVIDAEDSDDNEGFVYRDGGRDGFLSKNGSSTNPIPHTLSTQDPSQNNGAPLVEVITPGGTNHGASRSWKGQPPRGTSNSNDNSHTDVRPMKTLRKASNPGGSVDGSGNADGYGGPHRPVLRSTVSELPRKGRSLPQNYPSRYWYNQGDDESELASLLRPLDINPSRRCGRFLPPVLMTLGLIFVLSMGAAVVSTCSRPLTDVGVTAISNVLAAQGELIFDIHVRARNWNIWGVHITEANLEIFASSQNVLAEVPGGRDSTLSAEDVQKQGPGPAELLGTVYHFDEPLVFRSGILPNGFVSQSISQIRVKNPGQSYGDIGGNERWARMIRYPYELTVRGVLQYRLLPFYFIVYSVRVCGVALIDPATGQIINSPPSQRQTCGANGMDRDGESNTSMP